MKLNWKQTVREYDGLLPYDDNFPRSGVKNGWVAEKSSVRLLAMITEHDINTMPRFCLCVRLVYPYAYKSMRFASLEEAKLEAPKIAAKLVKGTIEHMTKKRDEFNKLLMTFRKINL